MFCRKLMGILCCLMLAVELWAQGDATEAMNPRTDPRLQQRVNLRYASVPLVDLLAQLTQKTGVRLEADPAVREHRACLYASNHPLHETLNMLADSFGYRWRRVVQPERPPRYVLHDPNPPQGAPPNAAQETVQQLKRLLPEICARLQTPLEQRMEAALKFAEERSNQSPRFENEEQARQWAMHAYKTWAGVASTYIGAWYAMCSFTERDWQRLQSGERILLSSKRTPALQPAIRDWTTVITEQVRDNYERLSRQEGDQWQREWQLAQQKFPKADEMRLSLRLDLRTGNLYAATLVFAEGENIVPYSANNKGVEWAISPPSTFKAYLQPPKEAWQLPNHPAFQKTIVPFKEPSPENDWFSWLGELLVQAAEASRLPLVAEVYPVSVDSYELYQWGEFIPKQYDWQTIARLLRAWQYRLSLAGDWIRITHDNRDIVRTQDIPQPLLARWLYKPNRRGVLSLEELAEFATLEPRKTDNLYMYIQSYMQRQEQLLPWFENASISNASELCGGLTYAQASLVYLDERSSDKRLIMRLYARLSVQQRALLRRGGEIPFTSLDSEAQELFLTAFAGGSLLLFDDLWLSESALHERAQTAALRLTSITRSQPGIVAPEAILQRNNRDALIQWLLNPENRQKHWALNREQRRTWQFILRWGEQEKVIEIPMGHPTHMERVESSSALFGGTFQRD
ncbi:MAG: hypothetical protein KatS3mg019_1549 [Fimbriimonadales bacterium]|nr:MAG: hypothetical protein KatS3mg019_1549 [Fimbriimonadales bacterium]